MVLCGDRSVTMEELVVYKSLLVVLGVVFGFVLSVILVVLGVLFGFVLSVIFSDARRTRRQAYPNLEDINSTMDQVLEKLLTSKDDRAGGTEYLGGLLVKLKEKCNHGLVMLEAKQGRYRALADEFERKLKTEKEQVEQRLEREQKTKHDLLPPRPRRIPTYTDASL